MTDLAEAGAETAADAPAIAGARARLTARGKAALALFAVLAVAPLAATAAGDPFLVLAFTRILVFAIAALSLDIILGYGALVSFGHAAYVGFGAYAVGILSRHGVTDIGAHLLAAIGVSAVFSAATGAIALRTRGVYYIMITLAFGQMAYYVFVSLAPYGGDDGMSLGARSTVFGAPLLRDNLVFYYVTLATLAACFAFATTLVGSRFGRVLTGAREGALRMQAIGFRPFPFQLTACVIAACMASVAGVLLANQAEFVSPAYMSWHRSGELIVMVILGGVGTLLGPVVGAIVALLLEEWLSAFSNHWKMGLGLALILVVLYSPGGVLGAAKRLWAARPWGAGR